MRPRWPSERAAESALGAAMFPTMPCAIRNAGNAFTFQGRRFEFRPNLLAEPFKPHGDTWQR